MAHNDLLSDRQENSRLPTSSFFPLTVQHTYLAFYFLSLMSQEAPNRYIYYYRLMDLNTSLSPIGHQDSKAQFEKLLSPLTRSFSDCSPTSIPPPFDAPLPTDKTRNWYAQWRQVFNFWGFWYDRSKCLGQKHLGISIRILGQSWFWYWSYIHVRRDGVIGRYILFCTIFDYNIDRK